MRGVRITRRRERGGEHLQGGVALARRTAFNRYETVFWTLHMHVTPSEGAVSLSLSVERMSHDA